MHSTSLLRFALVQALIFLFPAKIGAELVGTEVCVSGYVMDLFCINRGTLLDNPVSCANERNMKYI